MKTEKKNLSKKLKNTGPLANINKENVKISVLQVLHFVCGKHKVDMCLDCS